MKYNPRFTFMDSLKTPRFLKTVAEKEAGYRYIIFPQACNLRIIKAEKQLWRKFNFTVEPLISITLNSEHRGTQDRDSGGDGGESLNYKHSNDKTPGTLVMHSVVLIHLTTGWPASIFSKYKVIWLLYSQVTSRVFIILHLVCVKPVHHDPRTLTIFSEAC